NQGTGSLIASGRPSSRVATRSRRRRCPCCGLTMTTTAALFGLLCSDCNAAIMPFEFGSTMDDSRLRYLAEGDRMKRAKAHLEHRVIKTDPHAIRLVSSPRDRG